MNKLNGTIYNIQTSQGITLVDIRIGDDEFSSLIINSDSTNEYIRKGNPVNILFKETEISVKNYHAEFHKKRQNKIVTTVESINKGVILSELKFSYKKNQITAIILSRLLEELKLTTGSKAILILRTQEILLSKN
jgi:molybdopterin-binding protein